MRQAINENRTVQIALVCVLALLGALFLLKSKSGGSEATATAATPPLAPGAQAPAAAPSTAAPTDPTAAAAVPAVAGAAAAGATAAGVPANLIPGRGLPKSLVPAYHHGKAIVLLVRRAGGADDAFVHASVDGLRSLGGAKVYVTKARGIARYAWLTQGVNVTDLPALIVLRPRKLSKGKAVASVSYGFRNPESVLQAVKDELYRGPSDRPYHP